MRYPVGRDLSNGQYYLPFEQLGPRKYLQLVEDALRVAGLSFLKTDKYPSLKLTLVYISSILVCALAHKNLYHFTFLFTLFHTLTLT